MSKPLELTVNRPFTDRQGNDWYVWGDTCVRPWIADSYSDLKRLTVAEVSAEFWRLSWAAEMDPAEFEDQMEVMFRFASLPHYDQEQP